MIKPPGTLNWCRAAGLLLVGKEEINSVPKSGQCLFGHYNYEEI